MEKGNENKGNLGLSPALSGSSGPRFGDLPRAYYSVQRIRSLTSNTQCDDPGNTVLAYVCFPFSDPPLPVGWQQGGGSTHPVKLFHGALPRDVMDGWDG